MDDILQVAKNYSREKHIELLPTSRGIDGDSLLQRKQERRNQIWIEAKCI